MNHEFLTSALLHGAIVSLHWQTVILDVHLILSSMNCGILSSCTTIVTESSEFN